MTGEVVQAEQLGSEQKQLSELPIIPPNASTILSTKEAFEHLHHIAHIFAKAELAPKRYRNNVSNCVIALELSSRMGISPLVVMQNLDLVCGRPAWTTKFLIGRLNSFGRFSTLNFEEDNECGGRCRAFATGKDEGVRFSGAWASIDMAKAEHWYDRKDSKWKTMPELMLRYRAAAFFISQFAPEVSMGLQTAEEAYDIQEEKQEKVDPEHQRMQLMIDDTKTLEDLNLLEEHVVPELMFYFNEKKELLTEKK